jgi:hypothetical protein
MGILGFPNPDQRQFPRIKDNIFIFGNLKLHSTNLGTNPLANPIGGFRVFAKDISARGLRFKEIFLVRTTNWKFYTHLSSPPQFKNISPL